MMVDRFIEIWEELQLVMHDEKFDDIRVEQADMVKLEAFSTLLGLFQDATLMLSAEKTSTAGLVIPVLKGILKIIREVAPTDRYSYALKLSLLNATEFYIDKYRIFEDNDLILLTFLHPFGKTFENFSEQEAKSYKARAILKIREVFEALESSRDPAGDPEPQPISPVAKRPLMAMFNFEPAVERSDLSPKQALENEIKKYSKEDRSNVETIKFWKESKYKVLAEVALSVLACLATSTPSERSFSATGYQTWDRRYELIFIC